MTEQERYDLIEAKRRCKKLEDECLSLKHELSNAQRMITTLNEEVARQTEMIENKDEQIDKLHEYTEKVVNYLVNCSPEDRELFAAQFGIVPLSEQPVEE